MSRSILAIAATAAAIALGAAPSAARADEPKAPAPPAAATSTSPGTPAPAPAADWRARYAVLYSTRDLGASLKEMFALTEAQQTMIDEHTDELPANGLVQQCGDH